MKTMVLAVLVAMVIAPAPVAWADVEDDYLDALVAAGLRIDAGGRDDMVALGHWVCESLAAGATPIELAAGIQDSSPRLAGTEAPMVIVDIAVGYLCPSIVGPR